MTPSDKDLPKEVFDTAKGAMRSEAFQARIYSAIAVQRPVVLEYLRSLRREKPRATAAEILRELDNRYIAAVTVTSTGVGASAAIPGVGIPLALGLGVADLLFFYETSALYVLSVAELHDIAVSDASRARPLVFGMLLGEKSQTKLSKLVMSAAGGGGVDEARTAATGAVGRVLPKGWGEVLTEQIPDSALAPLTVVIAREALKTSGKLGAGALGKAIPFGLGAVIGGVGSFFFGRDVVKAARIAFPDAPTVFPEWLNEFARPERQPMETPRAVLALQAAAGNAKDFGSDVWDKVGKATDIFRSTDLNGDGVVQEARALTAAKGVGKAIGGAAGAVGGAATSLFTAGKKNKRSEGESSLSIETVQSPEVGDTGGAPDSPTKE